jgi:two-component system, cell cycle response regulator
MRALRQGLIWGVGAWLLLWEAHLLLAPSLDVGPIFSRFAHDVVLVLSSLLCIWGGLAGPRRERIAWLLIGAGLLAWSLGEIWYTAVLWDAETIPVPSPADVGYLALCPLCLAGAALLLRARFRAVPPALWVDGVTAALAVAASSAAIVFETVLDSVEGAPMQVIVSLAYPLFDLILIGMVIGALAGAGWRLDRGWLLLALGVAVFWLADSLYLVGVVNETYVPGSWFDIGWWLGIYLVGLAAWQPRIRETATSEERLLQIIAPLGFGGVGLGLLVYGCVAGLNLLAICLAAASLLAVMARLTVTFRQNVAMLRTSREEALTDALTELGNRRALSRQLDWAIANAIEHGETLVLVLFDLDGFKHYNDTFGHPAGDALLMRLGRRLEAFMGDRGHAFRMGGDEFCALFYGDVRETEVVGAAEALSEHGEGFSIGCSYGAIVLPREADDAAGALRIADQRMYAQKHAGRMSAGNQSKEVLLRALTERNPELGNHLTGVADLAEATARLLGLAPFEVEQVRHAAELHDVGKVAVPDEILNKPGPLDEREWEFIRRHTVIGERIIAAAPALNGVAALVRSSHERFDGAGYPDRLAGEAIPLGSRIVAVADAFDAMTTTRSYSAARSPHAALDELRACAGAQFDPTVVDAFCAAWAVHQTHLRAAA